MATTLNGNLQTPAVPVLPIATTEYRQQFQDQYTNALRLYFNGLNSTVTGLLGDTKAGTALHPGGGYLAFPYAAIQRTTDKTFTANTATQITFNQNDFLNDCSNDGTDGIHVNTAGIYNYQFSVQFANTSATIYNAYIWLRKNGVDLAGTGSKFDIPGKHGSSDGYLIAAANFYVQLQAGDYVEMWAATENAAVYMEAYAAQTSPFARPSIPSVVATLTFVSRLPS